MSITIRNIRKAEEQFLREHADGIAPILRSFRTSTLREKHFAELGRIIADYHKTAKDILYFDCHDTIDTCPQAPLNKRRSEGTVVAIAYSSESDGVVFPTSARFVVTPQAATLCNRIFPLAIDCQHTEFRHIERGCGPLTYASDDFRFAAELSIPLSIALSHHVPENSVSSLPCVIPHAGGFYKANAVRCDMPMSALHYVHPRTPKDRYVWTMAGEALAVPVMLSVWTSISFADFFPDQRELYAALRPFREDKGLRAALRTGIDMFAAGPAYQSVISKADRTAWFDMLAKLKQIVASPVWGRQVEIAEEKGTIKLVEDLRVRFG